MVHQDQLCDMHLHTCYSHDCKTPMQTIAAIARKHKLMLGICDHNKIGGSLAAHALGIPTIPAIEVTTKGLKDFLVYFHDFDNLKEFFEKTVKPNLDPGKIWGSRTKLTENMLFDSLKDYDCFTSLAHPYCPIPKRSAGLPAHIMNKIDAIEVMNFSMSPKANQKAAMLCDSLKKVHTAGSDSHHPSTIGMVTMRGYSDSPSDFLSEARHGLGTVVGMQRKNKDVMDKVVQYLATKA